MSAEFIESLKIHQPAFGMDLTDAQIERLTAFYGIIQEHNELLHLVAPMSAEEFAIRHILESLTLLEYLPDRARLADVGAGAGLPSLPCLLVRQSLSVVLIETKEKKAKFLVDVIEKLGLKNRAEIINRQFEDSDPSGCQFVTCRALDKFTAKLPRLLKWSKRRTLLLFGGDNLRDALQRQKINFEQKLTPMSEQRFLFITK